MNSTELTSFNPFTGEAIDSVKIASADDIKFAFSSAKSSQKEWARRGREERIAILRIYAKLLEASKDSLAKLISEEAGKPLWESLTEVQAMINKVEISIEADAVRCGTFEKGPGVTRFHPLGVVAVLGPFNFPGHLPNGHLVPALIAGNAALYKPSEQTPLVGAQMVELMHEAGVPKEVLHILHGGGETGRALVALEGLSGLYFTGSAKAGLAIHKALGGRPQTLLALEMGGNNPLLVDHVGDIEAAARLVCQSAFVTSGQRCTCARRLYVPVGEWGDGFVEHLIAEMGSISVGDPLGDKKHYLGTVISETAAEEAFRAEQDLKAAGGESLIALDSLVGHPAALKPGLIDVTEVECLPDEEVFGPLLQLVRYSELNDAIRLCNETRYGLAAGLISDSKETYGKFYDQVEAGIINLNTPLTGASSASPFGGTGLSGNHRPSAYFAADYCAYPTASMESESLSSATDLPGFPRIERGLK